MTNTSANTEDTTIEDTFIEENVLSASDDDQASSNISSGSTIYLRIWLNLEYSRMLCICQLITELLASHQPLLLPIDETPEIELNGKDICDIDKDLKIDKDIKGNVIQYISQWEMLTIFGS